MTNFEKLRTRIVIAQSVGINPDSVGVVDCDRKDGDVLYVLDKFKKYNLVLGFDHVPSHLEAREDIKELYMAGVESDFDEEMKVK